MDSTGGCRHSKATEDKACTKPRTSCLAKSAILLLQRANAKCRTAIGDGKRPYVF